MRKFNKPWARFWDWARAHVKWGGIVGLVLAIACHYLPPSCHQVCDLVANCLP